LLNAEPGVEIVAECRDGAETIPALKNHEGDLLFLDIRMPDMDGFEVLQHIPADRMPIVIFTTAYDQFAVRAFEAQALDYLLKPFDRDRLAQAINRARAEMLKLPDRETTHRLLDFLANAKAKPVKKIKELQPVNSGEYIVVLISGKELSCSRGYRAGLQQLIDGND
jgi:two-component system, LytTR family, response regulator